ncbi:hypothetical protein [Niabella soli]|uniref:Uncharacterized protein n=1 Tax=Niabella soli DSM 19437 TaxID=929713 RepID=W0F3E1_9BACT|nr:hypothetical protein [Niabella soli]AHF17560.1 hypothetical protein NIASO_09905 [Niabella soli DSM 19437]
MKNTIGDALPYPQRKILADLNFKVGSIFKFYDAVAKKEKRLILIGIRYDKIIVAFLRINTKINTTIFPSEELRNEHLELEFDRELRPFLTHTSYVNCSIFLEQHAKAIYNLLIDKPSIHIGTLCEADLLKIKHKISTSKLLSPSQKKNFGLFYTPLK